MDNPKRAYLNAGSQTTQGRIESLKFYDAPDFALFTVKCISLVLGIRLQKVVQIPVKRVMLDKRGYYKKGEIQAWMEEDLGHPDSLLKRLREEYEKTVKRMRAQPSRFYKAGQISNEEAQQAREKTKVNVLKEPDAYEALYWPSSVRRVNALRKRNKS